MKKDTAHNAKKPNKSRTKVGGFSAATHADGSANGAQPGYSSPNWWERAAWLVIVLSLVAIGFSWVVTLVLLIGD